MSIGLYGELSIYKYILDLENSIVHPSEENENAKR